MSFHPRGHSLDTPFVFFRCLDFDAKVVYTVSVVMLFEVHPFPTLIRIHFVVWLCVLSSIITFYRQDVLV